MSYMPLLSGDHLFVYAFRVLFLQGFCFVFPRDPLINMVRLKGFVSNPCSTHAYNSCCQTALLLRESSREVDQRYSLLTVGSVFLHDELGIIRSPTLYRSREFWLGKRAVQVEAFSEIKDMEGLRRACLPVCEKEPLTTLGLDALAICT
jgi:hypothetical protein